MKKSDLKKIIAETINKMLGISEYYEPTTLPKPKVDPDVKPEIPPVRRRIGRPDVRPKPKASLREDEMVKKIVQRYQSLKENKKRK